MDWGRPAGRLDYPQLYIYTYHGSNTFAPEHWEQHWQAAGERFEDHTYDIMVRNLEEQLNLDLSPWTVQAPAADSSGMDGAQQRPRGSGSLPPPTTQPRPEKAPHAFAPEPKPRRADGQRDGLPSILILTPVKDAERFLPRFWENLSILTYPHDRISLAFLESDSSDGTAAAIDRRLPRLRTEFARAELFKHDYGYQTPVPRWEASQQFRRRSVLAKSRNYLLSRALKDEEWALWIDVDLASWPPDVIERLLATGEDIVVPNCLQEGTGKTFDYNTFKLKPGAEQLDWSLYLLDGILLPPHGYGRYYRSDLRQYEGVEIDAVGATMLLIRADLHREGLVFPTYSHKYHIETEGLAVMARDMGYRCWGLPSLEIFHP